MTTSSQFAPPDWPSIAAKQWPNAKVEGNGQFAMIIHCTERPCVRLYDFRMAAVDAIRKPCGHAFCTMKHDGKILKELPHEKYFRKSNNLSRMIAAAQ